MSDHLCITKMRKYLQWTDFFSFSCIIQMYSENAFLPKVCFGYSLKYAADCLCDINFHLLQQNQVELKQEEDLGMA